jgi:hypothetical protein
VAQRSKEEYVRLAEDALMDLVRTEGAVLLREAEAKISDTRYPKIPTEVNPHHVTSARSNLLGRHWIKLSEPLDESNTRLLVLADDKGRRDQIRNATRRRKALHKRMEKWGRPRARYNNGLIGEAGERVARASLLDASPAGVRPVNPGAAEVRTMFGAPVPGGPLDSAAWVDQYDEHGQATGSILCPIEVKNIRHWVYPSSHELFQLLHKAALLQQANPAIEICPVLVTRKRSWTADRMSRDLGFRILDIHKQFVLPIADVLEDEVQELHDELGYTDLIRTDQADPTLTQIFAGTMRQGASRNAVSWRDAGAELGDHYETLRGRSLTQTHRTDAMIELRDEAENLGAWDGTW